jgi:hypothetical protein
MISALLGHYAPCCGNSLPIFLDGLSVPSSWPLKMGSTGCTESSAINYHNMMRNAPEERRSRLLHDGSQKSQMEILFRRNKEQTAFREIQLSVGAECLVLSCLVLSCLVLPCLVLSCLLLFKSVTNSNTADHLVLSLYRMCSWVFQTDGRT